MAGSEDGAPSASAEPIASAAEGGNNFPTRCHWIAPSRAVMEAVPTPVSPSSTLVEQVIAFVKKDMAGNDASHEWSHVERVWELSKQLAREEGVEDMEVVELGALLHDVKDWKYSGSETAGVETAHALLVAQGCPIAKADAVCHIIQGVSFKNSLPINHTEKEDMKTGMGNQDSLAVRVVRDADRLDAMGAIGIARCFAFGGRKGSRLYDPEVPPKLHMTKEQYMAEKSGTCINHFYEKLLTLKDKMTTDTGRRRAVQRHAYMLAFLEQFKQEWSGLM